MATESHRAGEGRRPEPKVTRAQARYETSIEARVSEANESRIEVRAIQVLGNEPSDTSPEWAVTEEWER